MRYKLLILFLIFLSILLNSCKRNSYRIDISGMEQDITIKRLENDLFATDPAKLVDMEAELKNNYGHFLELFGYITEAGNPDDPGWYSKIFSFATDPYNVSIYKEVIDRYADLSDLESELEKAWAHYKHYLPGEDIPGIYSFLSAFRNSLIIDEGILGIGLDRYLGPDFDMYNYMGIYKYLAAKMIPQRIVTDCMYAWATAMWPDESGKEELLNIMIQEGKRYYFARCMQPELQDSLLFGFTADQIRFCKNNEKQMWEYLVSHDMLFRTDQMTVRKLTGEAPFTSYFTNESPGKASVWIGFRIVESYMNRNPGVTLKELLEMHDAQAILQGAKYSPD